MKGGGSKAGAKGAMKFGQEKKQPKPSAAPANTFDRKRNGNKQKSNGPGGSFGLM